jgi:chromosome segregation ATPase
MTSGRQTLASLDQTLQEVRDRSRTVDEQIQRASVELIRLSQAESEQYKALAQVRVGQLTADDEVVKSLNQAERRVEEFLAAREHALGELQRKLDDLQERQAALESERTAQSHQVEQAAETLDDAEAAVQERLAQDAAYQAQLERARQAEGIAEHAEKKTTRAEQDRSDKGKPYEADPLFMYLWRRGYGTPDYQANPVIRYLDRKVAMLCGYREARANYAVLLEIPVRLREHAEGVRKQADEEFAALRALEQTAADAGGIPPLQDALAAEQEKLEALDSEIAGAEQQGQEVLQERATFVAGEDDDYRQAVELMAAEFRQDSIVELRREAQMTPLPEDDRIVERLAAIERERTQLEDTLEQYQKVRRSHQQRLEELTAIRQQFKRQHYDDVQSVFADGALVGVMLNEFLKGALSRDGLWRTLEQQQRRSRMRSDPVFGSGGLRHPGGGWSRGGLGGDFGGGGFHTGGDFGSGGGFRTGGDF